MYINEVALIVYDAVDTYHEKGPTYFHSQKILIAANQYYYVSIIVGAKLSMDNDYERHVIKEHGKEQDDYVYDLFYSNIQEVMNHDKNLHEFSFAYQYTEKISHKINVRIVKFMKETEFLYLDDKDNIEALNHRKQVERDKERAITMKWKGRIYEIILESGMEGIDLTTLIQKTRNISSPEKRKQYIKFLIDEKKIHLHVDTSKGKRRQVYRSNSY